MKASAAFTVTELLVGVGILAILVAIIMPYLSSGFGARASKVICVSNMRSLHVSFESFIQDNGAWPPSPPTYQDEDDELVKGEEWWLKMMDSYTDSRKVWLCPVLERGHFSTPSGKRLQMHYIPTQFDGNKMSPYRWPKQPWLIEMANSHGDGALVLFPDGSVTSLQEILNRK